MRRPTLEAAEAATREEAEVAATRRRRRWRPLRRRGRGPLRRRRPLRGRRVRHGRWPRRSADIWAVPLRRCRGTCRASFRRRPRRAGLPHGRAWALREHQRDARGHSLLGWRGFVPAGGGHAWGVATGVAASGRAVIFNPALPGSPVLPFGYATFWWAGCPTTTGITLLHLEPGRLRLRGDGPAAGRRREATHPTVALPSRQQRRLGRVSVSAQCQAMRRRRTTATSVIAGR